MNILFDLAETETAIEKSGHLFGISNGVILIVEAVIFLVLLIEVLVLNAKFKEVKRPVNIPQTETVSKANISEKTQQKKKQIAVAHPEEIKPQDVQTMNMQAVGNDNKEFIYCGYCGAKNKVAAKFCRECGHPLH